MTSITAKKEITTYELYELYKKRGAVYAPELKTRMKKLLESNPKEFIFMFKNMNSRELVELLGGDDCIEKFLFSMCHKKDMDALNAFLSTFDLYVSASTKALIVEAKEAVDKAITSLKEERAKRNEEKIIIHYNSSSGFTGYFKEGGELNLLVFFEKNPGGSVNTVELKDVL